MTQQILEMAREAGFNKNELAYLGDNFTRLVELAVAAEREACAKLAKEQAAKYKLGGSLHTTMNIDITRAAAAACDHVAHLINERGQA
jgi:hypothetical protein